MFQNRQEVDKHVNNSLKKISNETERNLRCFSFAKLYFNVGDYEQAVRYVNSYLSVKPKSPEGQNLLGKALEKLGKKDAALEAYRTSLQQDPKQNNLVIKVCELMAQDDVDIDNSGARYFCDLAQTLDPQNPVVFTLKEKLISNDSKDPKDVSHFLLKELENRPTDVTLRVRLLKHFLQNNMLREAYKHASDIEKKKLDIFDHSLPWYEIFAEVLVRYQRDVSVSTSLTWEFWFLSVSVLEKLAALSLSDHNDTPRNTTDYVVSVFNFDQSLLKASQNISSCPDKNLLKEFLNHYEAQLCFHLSVLAFKQAKKDLMTFKEVQNVVLPLLFLAYNSGPPDLQGVWFNNAAEDKRKMIVSWHKEGSFRCSQTGHILNGLSKDRRNIILEKANQYSTGMWREQLYKKIFVKRDQQNKSSTSFFVLSSVEPSVKLPEHVDLLKFDEVAQTLYPDSLHHYVWLILNRPNLHEFNLKSFDGLQYTIKNLQNCAAETLNVLDLHSFIYCAALCAQSKIRNNDVSLSYFNQDRPSVLPVVITGALGTLNQSKFLSASYKMYKNEHTSNMGEIRLLLIKGIEVIRCVGNHGLDVRLLVNLATIFAERAKLLNKQSEIEANNSRAELYWKTSLPLLEKLKNNHAIVYPNNRLFEYKCGKEMSLEEVSINIEKAKLFLGHQLMKKKEYEKAMHIFDGLKSPYASFYQSQIYKHMADTKTSQNKESVTSEMRSQNIILLSRARDCLYLTLDRLREPSQDRDHPLNAQLGTEIEKIERLLSRIDPDCTNRNDLDGMSDENVSDSSAGEHYLSTFTHQTSFHNGRDFPTPKNDSHLHSTPLRLSAPPRQEARPSPERLDAQLRQLAASKDLAISSIVEQNRMMADLQRSLMDEIRGFKDAVKSLTVTVDDQAKSFTGCFEDVKEVKKSVDELTQSVDDRLQSVTDMVQEIRKELNDIKKDQKTAQLSEEDLYVLDPDYNSALDYNLSSSLANTSTNLNPVVNNIPQYYRPSALQQLQQGAAAALPPYAAHGLYPGLYPGLPYPYGPLGLQHPLLPSAEQFAQLAQLPPNITGLTPNYQQSTASASLNLSSLTGNPVQPAQTLAQMKESPKTVFSGAGLLQSGLQAGSALGGVSVPQVSVQAKETVKPVFSTSQAGIFSQIASSASSITPLSKAPPVNVVITSSDPLPTTKTVTSQPILSVTIPPQHIKSNTQKTAFPILATPQTQPHSYQIPLTTTSIVASTASILSKPPPVLPTQGILSSVPSPAISVVAKDKSPSKNVSLGLQIEKTLDKTFSPQRADTSFNKSNISSTSVEEFDARPDFQPIVPLPDEVPVTTGEEKETELFCQRAKLFRHVTNNGVKEWKERGVGNIKILHNTETGKLRVLMRRDQVHKICANHFITKDMVLTPMSNNDRAYIWAAHDYADEEVVLEKFCVRFKTAEEAKKFADAFEFAKSKISHKPAESKSAPEKPLNFEPPSKDTPKSITSLAQSTPTNLGGFKFTSTPTFQPKEELKVTPIQETKKEIAQPSPFASFSFGAQSGGGVKTNLFDNLLEPTKFSPLVISSSNTSKSVPKSPQKEEGDSHAEDFVPTAEFKPVVEKLPDLVEVKTGEENAEVLFEERAKLFRYDTTGETKEWKERGVGIIKILKEDTIRLVMRREQVHKVCCNHQVLKNMSFKQNATNPKAVVWHAQDFSEGVLKAETFTVRFKTEELASKFLKTLQSVQTTLDENNQVTGKHHKAETPKIGFGDKFKPVKGSWECKDCYTVNESRTNICEACGGRKPGATPKKEEPTFSFGIKPSPEAQNKPATVTTVKEGDTSASFTISTGWGNAFKPKEGSWECQGCFVRNEADVTKCVSCETPKDGASTESNPSGGLKGISLDTGGLKFSFGMPPAVGATAAQKTEETIEKKPEQPIQKFSFSIPASKPEAKDPNSILSGFGDSFKPKVGTWECKSCYTRNEPNSQYCLACEVPKDGSVPKKESSEPKGVNLDIGGLKFNFGMPPTSDTPPVASNFGFGDSSASKTMFSWKPSETSITEGIQSKSEEKQEEKFVFGSPQKHDFEFKPRSPRRISTGQGDESDGSYVEEEEANVYFKPVIPLPDKVDVKTGEEDEEVLYTHRAKLFRFTGGEWKERGLGDLKILRDKSSGKLRVVMRREQVLKICLNHWLTKDVQYLPKDEKTWLFHAADFSEGELSRDQFCLRFKNAEVAEEFKKAIDNALGGVLNLKIDTEGKKPTESKTSDSDSDIEFVSETKVTPEEEKEAVRLGLPPKFFAYRQRPDCACEQCKKEDEYLKELFSREPTTAKPLVKVSSTNSTIFGTPTTSAGTPSSAGSVFGTPKSFSFATPTGTTPSSGQPLQKTETLKDLLQKAPQITPKSGSFTFKNDTPLGAQATPTTNKETPTAVNFSFGSSGPNIFGQNIFKTSTTSASGNPIGSGVSGGSLFGTSIFGGSTPKEGTTGNIFGGKEDSNSGTNIFSSSNIFKTAPPTNIFGGGGTTSDVPTSNVISVNIFNTNPPGSNLFTSTTTGTITTTSSTNIFATSTANIFATPTTGTTSTTTLFQSGSTTSTASSSGGSIFGSTLGSGTSSNTSIFGSASASARESSASIFGGGNNQGSSSNIFSAASKDNIFGTPKPSGNVFGQTIFGNKTEPKVSDANLTFGSSNTTNLKETDEPVLKCDTGLTFASLAAKIGTEDKPSFAETKKEESKTPFAFLGAGAPVFGAQTVKMSQKSPDKNKSDKQEGSDHEDEGGEHDDKEHDPHFEPIVPLPDQIVVSTGEENETVVFNERAKLFRFDSNTREWKERGVGQIKVLFHPENKTYRLLLRREQVHKVVLNQRIGADLELQPMSTSDKAWMWVGYNYTDDGHNLEKLAVRFKNTALAEAFRKSVQETVQKIVEIQANKSQHTPLPTTVQNFDLDVANDSQNYDQSYGYDENTEDDVEGEEDEDDEEDDEDDEDERSIMFAKRCTLSEQTSAGSWQQVGMGEMQVYYDPELYVARISVTDDNGELLTNTVIGMNTIMEIEGKECWWKAVEWADAVHLQWRTLKATFSSAVAAQEFHSNYLEGVNFAQEVGMVDEMPNEHE